MLTLLITGATGYIGKHVVDHALKRGYTVFATSRQNITGTQVSWVKFDFSENASIPIIEGIGAFIHLASNTASMNDSDGEAELLAAQKLLTSASESSAKFIYVSSQTARPDAPTAYGRTKWRIEQEVLSAGGWVVRPGQVYGSELRGLFGILVNTVRHLPILPVFLPAPKVQPIHVDDLAEGLLRLAERVNVPHGVYNLAAAEPVLFTVFLDEIVRSRLRSWRGFVPMPTIFIYGLASVAGKSLRSRLGLGRLRSLFDLHVMETAFDLNRLGLTLRPLHSGMHPSGSDRRRRLLQEGRALLAYVLKDPPSSILLRRYVHAVERMRGGLALGLPKFFLTYPVCLSLLNKSVWADQAVEGEYLWRLDAATVLAEATPLGSCRFLGLDQRHSASSAALSMTHALLCEIFWRMLRMVISPLIRFALGRARGAV